MMISVCVGATRGATIRDLIASILRQTYGEWELLLVVQGNDPVLLDVCRAAEQHDQRVHMIKSQVWGRSAALNKGSAAARGEIIAYTDDDCEVAPNWLETFALCFATEPRVGLVAGDLRSPSIRGMHLSTCPATRTIECIYDPIALGHVGPRGFYWAGANVAVRRAVLANVGPFDESLGTGTDFPSAEDVDFGLRAEELGIIMWTTPRSVVYHTHGRRYGLRAFFRHQRAYARGSGGLGAKLAMWDHRLSREWGHSDPLTFVGLSRELIRTRGRVLSDIYRQRYIEQAASEYTSRYTLGAGRLAVPREQP